MAENRVGSDQEAGTPDGERMKVVAIVQSRMGSTRLPGKAMLPLAGKSMTQNIVERVQRATKIDEVVLAFPDTRTDADTTFADLAVRCGCSYYRGTGLDENDLVGRYLGAAEMYRADIVVRIPGDNPCVEGEFIDKAIEFYMSHAVPFVTNAGCSWIPRNGSALQVDGLGAEVLSLSRLKWLDRMTLGNQELREHPHLWFERNQSAWLTEKGTDVGWNCWLDTVRLDVNDSKDYEFIKMIYDHFGHNRFTITEVLAYLDRTVPVG